MRDPAIPRGPRHVLLRYLSFSLLSRTVMCCAILIALMEILALLEQMTPILKRHLGFGGVLTYMGLHLPAMLLNALPLSVLIGALLLLTQMTMNSEVAILRAAGLSPLGFFIRLVPVTLLIGGFGFAMEDQVTPRSELALAAWWNRTDPHPETGRSFWFHVPGGQASACPMPTLSTPPAANELAHVHHVARAGHEAVGIDLYDRDSEGRLLRTLHAERAVHAQGQWTLSGIRCITVSLEAHDATATESARESAMWINPFGPTDMLRLAQESIPFSSGMILAALHGHIATNQTPGYLRAALFERLLRPLAFIVMLLLALPVIYIPPRTGLRSWLPVWCLGGGLLFIIVQGMFRAMGNAGLLPAPVATAPGLLIFLLAACTALLRNEDK
ncbi:transporter YjgP/YjgQ [Acetobacter estunensis NRIC 0472]|uniref:LptF/LptG family permease n=1 Tax=Acetobacter estunensis TaxID=104097 RepID=A0A967B866_9PROT|nr:LptF/LptG family permease [Acetobacter estunensis]NHO54658.1 LptF/LptG family permease [Acetobacter estunensis]GBQ25552.1 transporter YjgP/YjgQ [Acetobacter estunensis NRIC 0472]